jgi:manganese efflux pump family protein
MSPLSVMVIAFALSIDSGIACIGRGAGMSQFVLRDVLVTGFVFGLVEAATPVIGWGAGLAARSYVVALDHWIAFGLLGAVGGYMVLHGLRACDEEPDAQPINSVVVLVATAVGTSIDALAVGASLAFLEVEILVVAIAIGSTTCIVSIGGSMIGRFVGRRFGSWAEIVGGVALFLLGLSILVEHLSA